MVKYEAKIKGQHPEELNENEIADFFHYFYNKEIEYVKEIRDA